MVLSIMHAYLRMSLHNCVTLDFPTIEVTLFITDNLIENYCYCVFVLKQMYYAPLSQAC